MRRIAPPQPVQAVTSHVVAPHHCHHLALGRAGVAEAAPLQAPDANDGSSSSGGAAPSAAPDAASPGRCPFLASLPPPPPSAAPWYLRPLSVIDTPTWQEAAVAGRPLIMGEFLLQPAVTTCTGDLAREVLTSEGDKTTVGWPAHFDELFGKEAMILQKGEGHRALRALMQPAFTAEAVGGFV
jgi:hypothetical protein